MRPNCVSFLLCRDKAWKGIQPNYDSKNDHPPFSFNALIYTRAVTAPKYKVRTSFVDPFCYLCFVSVMLPCMYIAALWSPAGKG